jgi:hypothetical protein
VSHCARDGAEANVTDPTAKGANDAALSVAERLARLDSAIAEGRLIRREWTDAPDERGRERACLLGMLSPEAARDEDAGRCPAAIVPTWLAELTPWIDDSGSAAAWPVLVQRYAALARRWRHLSREQWGLLAHRVRELCVHELALHMPDARSWAATSTSLGIAFAATHKSPHPELTGDRLAWAILDAIEAACRAAESPQPS